MILANLVAQTARAAVNHHRDLIAGEPERARDVFVVDLGDVLQLREVIAGAKRSELRMTAFERPLRNEPRFGAFEATTLFNMFEIDCLPEPAIDGPCRAALEHAAKVFGGELQVAAMRAHARRHARVHRFDDVAQPWQDVRSAQS